MFKYEVDQVNKPLKWWLSPYTYLQVLRVAIIQLVSRLMMNYLPRFKFPAQRLFNNQPMLKDIANPVRNVAVAVFPNKTALVRPIIFASIMERIAFVTTEVTNRTLKSKGMAYHCLATSKTWNGFRFNLGFVDTFTATIKTVSMAYPSRTVKNFFTECTQPGINSSPYPFRQFFYRLFQSHLSDLPKNNPHRCSGGLAVATVRAKKTKTTRLCLNIFSLPQFAGACQ